MESALELVRQERISQITNKGYTASHDDTVNEDGELAGAAAAYLHPVFEKLNDEAHSEIPITWPERWNPLDYKPSQDRLRNLVKGAALAIAEIEKLQRQQENAKP